MLIIKKDKNSDINQMLKKYKRKYRDTKMREELRNNKYFTKKSVQRRNEILDAQYREKYLREQSES